MTARARSTLRAGISPWFAARTSIAERYLTGPAAAQASPETLRAVRQWHAAETTMLASHHLRTGDWRSLVGTTQQAFRAAPLWPLRGAREVVAWLWKKAA
jgi:hypothetical protein